MNTSFGRSRGRDNLEVLLAEWLAGFEPPGAPVSLTLRIHADLSAEAERRRARWAWLRPALSLAGSLAAICFLACLLLALPVLSSVVDVPGFSSAASQGQENTSTGSGPRVLLTMAACGVAAGFSLYLPFVRRTLARLVVGQSPRAPGAVVAIRRPWRAVGRLNAALVAVAGVTVLVSVTQTLQNVEAQAAFEAGSWGLGQLGMSCLATIIAWRYPRQDRSTRLLLAGAFLALVYVWLIFALALIQPLWDLVDPRVWELSVIYFLPMAAAVVVAAGVVARSDIRHGPPTAPAAVCVALGFMILSYTSPASEERMFYLMTSVIQIVEYLNQWFFFLAWLAIAWIGLVGFRRSRSAGWLLTLAAGAIGASGYAGYYLWEVALVFGLIPDMSLLIRILDVVHVWYQLTLGVSWVALVLALAVGLRPLTPQIAPASGSKPEPDTPPAAEGRVIDLRSS
jgi:hypothetical protein